MSNTVNNNIPFVPENTIDPASGLNEALNVVDALLQLRVISVGLNTPPASPAAGDRYIVGTAPTGAWAGQAGKVARWLEGMWSFFTASIAVNNSDGVVYTRAGSAWNSAGGGGTSIPDWAVYSGAADAIVLTSSVPRSSYRIGDKIRFLATSINTGAATVNLDGLGAKSVVTVTGVALPAGYIRTDVETAMTYDGTKWVADRTTELIRNASGTAYRYADGRQLCWFLNQPTPAITNTVFGNLYISSTLEFTYPAAFATNPRVSDASHIQSDAGVAASPLPAWGRWRGGSSFTGTGGSAVGADIACGVFLGYKADGFWYLP